MATAETPDKALLCREIRRAADAEFFNGLGPGGEMQAHIKARISRDASRRNWRVRSWWAAGSVAAAVALTAMLGQTPAGRRGLPPASPIALPAAGPNPTANTPAPANPGGSALDIQKKATGDPASQHQGPGRTPFGVDVRPTGGTMPSTGALPEFLAHWPVVIVQPGTALPLRLTWRASGNEKYQVDLGQSQWEIVGSNAERQRQPLRLASGVQSLTFDGGAPLSLDATVQAPQRPGWYSLFLTATARSDGQTPVQGAGTSIRLFVSYPAGTLRTGDVVPAAAESVTRDGISLRVERVQMTELMTEVDYRITLPTGMHAPIGHNTFLAWDGGEWVDPVTVGEREGAPDPDGRVRSVTGQAIFPPTPRTAGRQQVRVPSLDVVVPTGGAYGSVETRPGPWVANVDLPQQ